jgi:hypothetical protein
MLLLAPLRIPSGWLMEINSLYESADARPLPVEMVLFSASNAGRRFRIHIDWLPQADLGESFALTVYYQPWPRNDRGRRRNDGPFAFGPNEEVVETWRTSSYSDLLDKLQHWLDRCTVWCREGH